MTPVEPSPESPMTLLSTIQSPADLKRLRRDQLPQLAQEIRDRLIECVSMTGGHIGAEPRRGRADHRAALRVRLAQRQDRLGRRPPGLRLEAAHRPQRSVPDAAAEGRHLRLPQAHRERARPVRRRPRRHRHVGGARHGHGARSQGRGPQGRRRRGRRRADLRPLLRGDEQRRPLRPRHHRHPQRQRDVDLAQRRRDQHDARPDRRRSAGPTGCARRSRA